MKVVILCGGQGTRLREHTERIPKPLVPVGDRPIVWHIMQMYAHHGFHDFVLCLGYKGMKIREYFLRYDVWTQDVTVTVGQGTPQVHKPQHTGPAGRPLNVTLVDTGEHAMTGARLKRVAPYLHGERFMLTYGDGVSDVDIGALLRFHKSHGGQATVTGVRPPARFGELLLEGSRVDSFNEKPQVRDTWINGGFFVFERSVLDRVSADDACVLERGPLEDLAARGQLHCFQHTGFWQCMDTWRDYRFLNDRWTRGDAPWATWQERPTLEAVT